MESMTQAKNKDWEGSDVLERGNGDSKQAHGKLGKETKKMKIMLSLLHPHFAQNYYSTFPGTPGFNRMQKKIFFD